MAESRMDNKRFSSMFRVGRSAGQNIPNIAWTVIQWDWQLYDELNEMAIVNPWTFVPVMAGYYFFNTHALLLNLTLPSIYALALRLNGAFNMSTVYGETTNVNEDISLSVSTIQHVIPTDAVDVVVWHNNGIIRVLQGNQYQTAFIGYRIR